MKTKAQIWGLDLMVAIIIFVIGIITFYLYSLNYPSQAEDNLNQLFYEGDLVLSNILSEGYPENWNSESVIRLGILSNNQINNTKLEQFYNLASSNYQKTRTTLNTKYDYYFFLSKNFVINSQQVSGIGKPGIDPENIQASNLIKITRAAVYNKEPVTAYLYIWE